MNKRIVNISLILLLGSTGSVLAQQGIGTNRPHKSAAVEIESTNKGLLIPRMELKWEDEKIVAPTIDSPAKGLLVFNNKNTAAVPEGFYYFSNALWNPIGVSELDSSTTTTITGNGTATNPYKIEVKELKGDVTGSILTNKVVKIQGVPVSSDTPTSGQVLKIDSGTWTPSTLLGSDISDPKNLTANAPLHVNNGTGAVLKDVVLRVDTADTNTLGVVKIGEGINVNNGVISVPPTPGETTTYLNFDSSTTNLTYLSEDTSTSSLTLNLGDVIRGNQNNTFVTGSTPINIDSSTVGRNTTYNVSVDTATATTLGIVKPGIGLTIDSGSLNVDTTAQGIGKNINTDGLILVNDSTTLQNSVLANTSLKIKAGNEGQVLTTEGTTAVWKAPTTDVETKIQNTVVGHKIADYTNELNSKVDINETITKLSYDSSTNVTYLGEDTSTLVFNLGDEVRKNQKTTTVVGNGAVKVTPTSANTTGNTAYTVSVDTATATTLGVVKPGTGITITADGTLNVLPQADTVTTLTGVKPTGNAIGTYKNEAGTDVVINETITSVKFDSTTSVLTYTPETGETGTIELNLSSINSDKQQLSLDTNTLKLERSESVDLSKYLDNTDNQSLSFDTSSHILKITGDSNTIDFSNYKNKVYTLASDTNTISLLADGASIDSETVVKNVALSLSTDKKLTATVNGVSSTTPLDLSTINTDNQYLTFDTSTNTLAISGDSRTVQVITKLDTGTNTTLTGNGTAGMPYKVGVSNANAKVGATAGTLGVVKPGEQFKVETDGHLSVKYAMPEFFYYPAINIKLDTNTLDLYGIYKSRFESSTMIKSANTEQPNLAALVLPASMIDIYVTYYDSNVINTMQISNEGVMTYTLKSTYTITDESYMNIVFKVRKSPRP